MDNFFFLIHTGATLFLTGLIWTIQVVHYPLFANVGTDVYKNYQTRHMSRIAYIVAPVMFAELATAVYLALFSIAQINPNYFRFGLALVLLNWISTLFVQSPIHGKLAQDYDDALIKKLVTTNWLRTVFWTLRGGLILWIIWLKIK
jgi:hypothetical protein